MDFSYHSQDSSSGFSSQTVSSTYKRRNETSTSFSTHNVVENLMSSIERKRSEIKELNNELALFMATVKSTEAANKRLSEDMKKMTKDFIEKRSDTETEHTRQIQEMKKSIREQSEKVPKLEANVKLLERSKETNNAEITRLRTQINKQQKELQEKDDMQMQVTLLEAQIQKIRDEHQQMISKNDTIRREKEAALTKQMEVQYEYEKLAEEKNYQAITSKVEIGQLRRLLSNFEVVQQNLEEVYKAEFRETLQIIQDDYNTKLDNLREEKHGSYKYQKDWLVTESSFKLEERITEQKSELRTLIALLREVRPEDLDSEISKYRTLLVGKTEKRESSELHEEKKNKIPGQPTKDASATISAEHTSSSTEHQADSSNIQPGLMDETTGFEAGYKDMDKDARKDMQQTEPSETSSVEQKSSSSDDPYGILD